jgi:CMP-N-acetylneuraminic acid synthetase
MSEGIVAIVPARGGSKGIPKKNIALLAGKPLLSYSIEVGLESSLIDRVFVSTDDEEIAKVALSFDAEILHRPKELAGDDTPDLPVFQHAISYLEDQGYHPEILVNLRPTCPLRDVKDVNSAIQKMVDSNCDAVRTITTVKHHPYWMGKLKNDRLFPFIDGIDVQKYYQRQLLPDAYIINGGVDVMRAENIIKNKSLYGNDIRAVFMPPERSIDIDTNLDLRIAETILSQRAV